MGVQFPGCRITMVRRITARAPKAQQCCKYFLQYSTFASEKLLVRTWVRQTCFLPRAPSNFSTSLNGAWTSAPLSAHLSTKWECTASEIKTRICTRRTTAHQFTWQQQQKRGALGGITDGMQSGWRTLRNSILSAPTSASTLWNGHANAKSSMDPA